jgi:hypothetical protein
MNDLRKFRAEYGHCHVPLNECKFPKLGLWVKEQRRHFTLLRQEKQSHMTEERVNELNSIGFCWDTHEATWLDRLRELKAFKAKYGHTLVPTSSNENPKLGTWVHHQRRQYKKFKEDKECHITAARIATLDALGFVWYPRNKSNVSSQAVADDVSCSDDSSETDTDSSTSRPLKRQRAGSEL